MREPKRKPETRDRLLDAARDLLLSRGFAATSVDDICRASRLTKGSFFHYFDSKEELAQAVLRRFCEGSAAHFEALVAGETDPVKRVFRYVDGAIRMSRDPGFQKGCLLGGLSQECCDSHPRMRAQCCDGFEQWSRTFSRDLKAAAAVKKVSLDPKGIAEHFIAVLEGSLLLGKAKGSMAVVEKNLRHFRTYLGGLLKA